MMSKKILQAIFSEQTLLIILFLILTFSSIGAKNVDTLTVISTTGLNLRSAPYTNSEIIGKIAFGEKVIVLETLEDTQYTLNTSYTVYSIDGVSNTIPIEGYWIKVEVNNEVGYLFSAYLAHVHEKEAPSLLHKDFVLLFQRANCYHNFHIKKNWYWYAMTKNHQGYSLTPTNISYVMLENKEMGRFNHVIANVDAYVYFIIGSESPIPSKQIIQHIDIENYPLKTPYSYHQNELNEILNLNNAQQSQDHLIITSINPDGGLLLKKGNKSQKLEALPKQEQFIDYINFIGDIDGDDVRDFVIRYGDKSSMTILYLSSLASQNQILTPVAIYYAGYCC